MLDVEPQRPHAPPRVFARLHRLSHHIWQFWNLAFLMARPNETAAVGRRADVTEVTGQQVQGILPGAPRSRQALLQLFYACWHASWSREALPRRGRTSSGRRVHFETSGFLHDLPNAIDQRLVPLTAHTKDLRVRQKHCVS